MFTAALLRVATAGTRKQPKCPSTGDWMKSVWSVEGVEYYSPPKNDDVVPFATAWMDPESVTLSEISQMESEAKWQEACDFTPMWGSVSAHPTLLRQG